MAWTPPAEEEKKPTGTSWTPPENEVKWTPPAEDDPENPVNEKEPWRLKKLKESGVTLSEEQEKLLWKYEEDKPILQKASEAVTTFFPAAVKAASQLGTGSVDLIYKGVLKPIDAMSQTPEEAEKTLKEAGNAWRSFGSGAMSDMEETIDMATRFSMFGSGITDKLQGLPEEERFKRFKNREVMRQFGQAVREEMPDRAAAIISENPILQKAAGAYAKLAGGTPEEVKMAEEAFTELVKESALTKEELDENISMLGEFMSPIALPGGNRITGAIAKPVGKVVQKTGELALRGIKPIAGAVEGTAELTLKGTELLQGGARKIGEYTVNDPDTWFKTTANTIVTPVNLGAKPKRSVARVVKDVTSQVDVGGAAGRRGLFERAGRAKTSSDLTRRLFGPQGKGGVARAKVADWTVRQANAIVQPGVNGAALNVLMGLPDIETAAQLGDVAGTGFGIGGFAGARVFDRAGAIIDPTTSLAEKITTVVTPDLAQRRLDEDADIKRFLATATPEMKSQMADLSNIDKRKTAIDSKLINLRQQKERTINAADEANLQRQIDGFEKQRQALDKATPETVREAERQVQLAFMDAMDLAQATGTSAGLRGLNLTVLNADNAEGFFRNLYGGAVERAEGVVDLLTGRTDLTMQESQNLQQARELLDRFSTEVAGAKNQRGFAIGVDGTDPNAEGYVPPHLRKVNQTGATAVINGDLVKHLSQQGFDVRRVINHEMQHALQQFREVKKMLAPIRGDLFDQKVVKDDGTVEVWKQGIFSDADITRYGAIYAAKMSPADNGASFIAQFQDVDAFNAYIKDEILAEVASQTGDYSNGTRAALDDVGRNLVDWLEVKTKAGALRKMKEGLRTFGIVFDNYGGYSNVLGADLPPQALAMIRQYQRQLRDFDGSMQIQTTREEDAPDIPMTAILGSRALQEKYKDADFFEKEQILRSTAPDGTVTEIVMPKGAKLDPFVDIYRIQGGQLVDANGNPVQLPPEITFGSLPEGSTFQVDTKIARKSDGSPITLSPREIKSRALKRTQSIRNVIDSAPDDGTPNRLIDTGNGNYRGVMSPSQLAAVLSIPNNVLAPALKRQIQFFNELMQRGDGTRAIFEYQPALLNGKYKAISPKIRDEVPIGWQFTKDGNFALTTISVSRLYDKLQAWADQGTVTQEQTWTGELIPVKRSKNLALWNGDTNKFWNSLVQVLDNHANGREGWVGLHSDELTAKRMRNKVNDLFNVFNKETKEMNPDRSTLPRVRGRDNVDIIVRSRRVDRINSFSESPSTKVPVNYGKLLINYMPETNPLAAPQTPEQFMEGINGSVSATRIRNAIATGAVDQLEAELRNSDDLLPTESLFVSQGEGGDPLIQVTSMLDPNVEGALEPEEVVVDLDARTAAELARLEAAEQTAAAEQQAALDAQQAQATAEQQTNQELELAIEAEARDNERYRTSLEERIRSGVAFSNAVVAPAGIQFLPAFHGSPHDFDKFSIGKIGTGEGQQAFGYGLYFAGAKAVGEGYRAKLARDIRVDGVAAPNEEIIKNQQINDLLGILTDALKVRKSGMMPDRKNIDRAIRMLEDEKEASVDNTYAEEILNWWFNSGSKGLKDPSKIQYGTLYKVELDVDDSNLLDWDKPLSEQSKTVQEAVLPTIVSELDKIQKARQAIVQRGTRLGGLPFRPGELEKLQKPMPDPLSLTGRAAYVYVTNTFGGRPYEDSPKASDFLLSRGIAGIRYFDAMSRGAGEGTHNYVIFDDKLITVLEKNDKPVGPVIQFMPAVQTIPERFTGTGQQGEERRGRYKAPPEFWTRFDIGEFERGGKFFDMETGEDITDKTYATGTIDVTGKRPSLISDTIIDEMPEGKGRTWKTNLFRKSAGWEWISENPPEVAAIGSKEKPIPVLISVENNPDHFYALKVDFPNGVKLARYPEGGEPRLRPTKKGQIQLGNEIGRIKTAKKEHPVYDTITIGTKFMPAESDAEYLRLAQDPEANQEKLQKMVDDAAKAAGYQPKKLFHGTLEGGFTKFDPEKIGSANDKGWFGKAFWFSDDYGYSAANYAGEYRGKLPKGAEVKEVYLNLTNPKLIPWVAEDEKARRTNNPELATQEAINEGHDGFLVQKNPRFGEWYEYGVFNPNQIKSADPVTYDDAGNVIPLSQRFQTTSPDIRFMPAEGDFEQIRRDAIDKRNKRRDEAYEILYSVIPETADILKRKINFEDDQQEFNSIPFSMPSVGFDYDRSFHLTKIVRRILDTLDPMADTKAIQNLRRKWDTASPIDKQDIQDRIKKYEDRIKKTASTMKYAFGVFADLTASLPEAKARDLRQDKIVDPWVVLKKHFPDGESKDINKVILELRDIIKFGTEKENFKSSINNVLNAAEVLRDFTDVDQSVIDQLFKDRYNKSEAQIKKDEEEFFKEVTNPEFYDVEKRGTATFSQKIEPQGGIQFMPAESDAEYLRLAQDPEANREKLQRMVDEAAKSLGYSERLYRGFRTKPNPDEFELTSGRETISLTPVKEVANLYSHEQIGFGGIKKTKQSTVHEFYVDTKNLVDLRDIGTRASLEDIINEANLSWNFYPEKIVKKNYPSGRDARGKKGRKLFTVNELIELLEELDSIGGANAEIDVGSGDGFVFGDLQEAADYLSDLQFEWDETKDPDGEDFAEKVNSILYDITLDVYRVADTGAFKDALMEDNIQGIIHKDTVEAGADYFVIESVAGRPIEEVQGVDVDDDFSHDTYRVFSMNQMKLADPITRDNEGNVIPLSQRFQTTSPDIRFMPAESDVTMPVAKVLDVYEREKDPNLVRLGMDIDLFPGKREARVQVKFNNLEDVNRALSLSDNEDAISLPEWISATIESKIPGFKSSGWGYLSPEDIIDNKAMISVGEDVPAPENIIPFSPDIRFMPAEQGPLADIQAPEQTKTEPLVPKTLQTDAGDFSVVIGGKPGKYGFGYTTVTELQPKLELSQQRKKELLETLTPRNDELSKKRDALLDVGNTWWENDDLIAKPNRNEEDMKRLEETSQFLREFMAKEDKEFTLDDAIQVAQVNRLTKKINELQKQLTPAPFKFPADRDVALKSLQSTVATIFKTKKFKDFIEGATGVSNIQFNNIFGTWKFDPEPSFVFSAPGMTWEQSQVVTKWLSFLMTQDAGIAWKPSIGLTEGVSSVYLIHDKKLTEAQILKAFEKAKEVGIDGLSLTVDGKGIKGANFDGIEGFYDKLAEIQKAAGIKNAHETLVDSFYYDTTSDFTAEDGSTRVPDWLKGESINEKNTQDQQGGSDETGGIGGDNTSTRGLTILLRRGIDSVLVPYAKALAGEGFIFDPDLFAQRYGLGQEVADYIREQLYPKKGLSRSVTPILEGTEKFVVPESFYTKDGKLKTSVNDLMYALQRRSADDGFIAPGDYSPQAGKIISETIVDEVLGHIERAKKNPNAPNAIGWYDAALKRMKKEYAKYFPFLNRNSKDYNPDKEFVFDSVLGITSQGNNVFENGKMAARVQFLLENGKTLPEVVADLYDTFGGQTRAIENNLLKLDQLLKNNETQTLDKIFRKKMTVSKWNAYLKKNKNLWYDGKPLSVDGQADQMVTGFSVFGPKIGSFINNLHGDYSTLTADLWFTRTWNRILGNVFQHASLKEANQYDSFRDALIEQYRKYLAKNYAREFKPLVKKTKKDGEEKTFEYRNEPELDGLSEMDFAELINDPQKLLDFATTLEDRFRTGQYKQKSDLRRAAKNWVENRSDPVAAPRTDLERDFQQNVMEIAQKKLRKMGIDISIADMQAALWYNEKELFGLYGAQVSGAEPADYADSAENVSELLSYGTLFQLERQVEQADGTKKKEIIRLVPYDAELGLTKIENAKTPEQYSRLVAARKKAADDAKKSGKKLEKAEAKVEEKTQELARINPDDEKAKQKAEAELAKAKQVLADLKLPATDAPLTEIKPPVE